MARSLALAPSLSAAIVLGTALAPCAETRAQALPLQPVAPTEQSADGPLDPIELQHSVAPEFQYGPVAPGGAQPQPVPIQYPAVPGALPPGLYRAGAIPQPPPAFYDLSWYYNNGYTALGGGPGFVGGFADRGFVSTRDLRDQARIPYRTALRDAQDFHYLNQVIRRDQALLRHNVDQTRLGLAVFQAGRYEQAAIKYLNAAEANHGDAASRVHAAHALFALGRYDEAVKLLRRAFELVPRLATEDYDIRDDYGDREDFRQHLGALEQHVAAAPNDPAGALMLGYVRFYSTGPSSGHEMLIRARQLDPTNDLAEKLLAVSSKVFSPNRAPASRVSPRGFSDPPATPPPQSTGRPRRG